MTSTQNRNIGRPREPFAVAARKLHFDDYSEHWLIADEQNHGVCTKLRRHYLREIRRGEPGFGVRWELEVERVTQKLGRELGLIPKEQHERLVIERRHRGEDSARLSLCSNSFVEL
ncbi:MAG: hypothetical protein ABUL62_02890 [Myxococcales bacterium]